MFLRDLISSGLWAGTAKAIVGAIQTGVTALAGGANSASTPQLTGTLCVVATCATAADSVRIPVGEAGDEVTVANQGAAACAVFPQTGGAFNGGTADVAFSVTNGKVARFKCIDGLNWVAGLSA
jgi:hypothetical protein